MLQAQAFPVPTFVPPHRRSLLTLWRLWAGRLTRASQVFPAPDLLEALELLLDVHDASGMLNNAAAKKARAAIAKATGAEIGKTK